MNHLYYSSNIIIILFLLFYSLQCGDSFIQFYTDLCIFAINVDKGYLDKLVKESGVSGPGDEAAASKRDMAKVI